MDWEKHQADLERWAGEGLTADQVAEKLGITRSAVLGRAHRTGVRFHWTAEKWEQKRARNVTANQAAPPAAKLDERKVREIRKLRAMGMKQVDVAKRFGVRVQAISAIDQRRSWAWVE